MGKFDTGQGNGRAPERLEASHHRSASAFDRSMILLNEIVEYWLVLTPTYFHFIETRNLHEVASTRESRAPRRGIPTRPCEASSTRPYRACVAPRVKASSAMLPISFRRLIDIRARALTFRPFRVVRRISAANWGSTSARISPTAWASASVLTKGLRIRGAASSLAAMISGSRLPNSQIDPTPRQVPLAAPSLRTI